MASEVLEDHRLEVPPTTSSDSESDDEWEDDGLSSMMSALGVLINGVLPDDEEVEVFPAFQLMLGNLYDNMLSTMPPVMSTTDITLPDDYDSTYISKLTEIPPTETAGKNLFIASIPSTRVNRPGDARSQWVFYRPTIAKVVNAEGFPQPVPKAKSTEPSFEVKKTPNMGMGVFATRDIAMGELIIAERPMLIVPRQTYALHLTLQPTLRQIYPPSLLSKLGLREWETLLKCAFDRMPPEDQKAYMELTNIYQGNSDGIGPIWGIMQTNSFSTSTDLFDEEDFNCVNTYCAVMKIASRLNHSCMPNVDVKFALASFSWQITASVDIKAGEQLFCSYGFFETLPVLLRRAILKQDFAFECHCPACEHATPESDAFRAEYEKETEDYLLNLNWAGKGNQDESIIEPVAKLREALRKEGLAYTKEYSDTAMMLGNFYEGLGMKDKAKPFLEEHDRYMSFKGDRKPISSITCARAQKLGT